MPDISKSKGNRAMAFGQSIQYNMIYIFLQKSCRKKGRETSARPLCFSKKLYQGKKQVVITLF